MIKNHDYMTQEEVNHVHAIKREYRKSFEEIANEIGIKGNFFSKLMHGKRAIPPRVRPEFNKLLDKYIIQDAVSVTSMHDIPRFVIIEHNETGERVMIKLPEDVFFETEYRRSSEENRGDVLEKFRAIPAHYHYVGTGLPDTLHISAEEFKNIYILKLKYHIDIKDIGKMCGVQEPTRWSTIVQGHASISKDQRDALHKLFAEYGLE